MPAKYHIEEAKSSRSKCKKCKEPIGKGELRIGTTTERDAGGDSVSMTSWHHICCFALPRALKREGATPSSFVEEDLDDPNGVFDEEGNREKVITAITAGGGGAKKKKVKAEEKEGNTFIARIKRNSEVISKEDEDDPPSKRIKKEERKEVQLYEKLNKMTTEELKDFMRWNRQIVGGTKALLVWKCLDGALRGRLGRCPMCAQSRLKIDDASSQVAVCTGYFDEDANMRVKECTAVSLPLQGKAPRLQPWFTEEPLEEEKKKLDELDEQAKSGKIADGTEATSKPSHKQEVSKMLEKAKKVSMKVCLKAELKETAGALLEIAKEGGLNLPSEGGIKSVGRVVVANSRVKCASEIMQLLVDEFGFAADEAKAAKASAAAVKSVCKVAENAGCYQMLDEFNTLARKHGDFRKANAYKTSAQAVASLSFAVTVDNALKLGKPGALKTPGIGKSTAEKLLEFVETGTVARLEELRAT
eukprot:CAMPEP_0194201218 /NCGR_PEP_ID=MMETSP0156-20130528/1541_1 /TAXON_ID=33649 /ORGANISM="Thalassionema nitzschioides, Strain L26-B" /LENGTH=473 /DNA_ID=CAMNT_0038926351 /DNA_START=79 /DNA_END=1500 /DNA_ORIENTATION=+